MTNTENTKTARELAAALDVETDVIKTAAFMLGAVPVQGFVTTYSAVDSDRIFAWVCGNGGQDIDGGVY